MKLKYYMRGLGIGIILTTLIFTISNNSHKLTDQEIIKRATELGMVSKDESDKKLEDLIKPTVAPTPEPTEEPTETPTPEPTVEPTEAPTPEPTMAPTEIPKQETEENTDTVDTSEPENTTKTIGFTIKKGMTSGQVAKLLVEVGLIEDAIDFNNYIVGVGKASIINIGEFNIPEDATYEEIVTVITS